MNMSKEQNWQKTKIDLKALLNIYIEAIKQNDCDVIPKIFSKLDELTSGEGYQQLFPAVKEEIARQWDVATQWAVLRLKHPKIEDVVRQGLKYAVLITVTPIGATVEGKTYPLREQIKQAGGRWNGYAWAVPIEAVEEVAQKLQIPIVVE